jgi:uncharacterized integral membrane protein
MELNDFDRHMSAAAYAEAGEFDTARKILEEGKKMKASEKSRRPYLAALVFGALSLSAYLFLFANHGWVMNNFTAGGWHFMLPVGTALFFSFVHGAFASNLISSLGIEAKK